MDPIYLDYNATTPISPEVANAMRPYMEAFFGNPSSIHSYGTKSKLAVENARAQVAALLNCDPSEIVFTSGGTESNNYALKGVAYALKSKGRHIISSSIEHPAIFEVCQYLEKNGFRVSYLPVDEFGLVSPADVAKAISPDTILISIMHANNEVGSIQPISEIAAIAKENNILMHTDAAQSLGKIDTDVKTLNVDLLSIAGHKLYAPKGIGALYIKNGVRLEKLIHGADHEQNLRAGTENVLEIVGLGKACQLAKESLSENARHYKETRDLLESLIMDAFPKAKLNGHPELRLPNTLSISFPGIEANTLVSRLQNLAVSAGAACHSESIDLSAVLEAMKIPVEIAMGTIRFSTGRSTTIEEIRQAAAELISTVRTLMPKDEVRSTTKQEAHGEIKLTKYTHGLGCACKIEPQKLETILHALPFRPDPNVLVGTETSDDACVYLISKELAIVQSLDFFTPIVDDPYSFGAIAAANALSDIYAMGAKPLFGMNIVGFPEDVLPMSALEQILKGAHDKAAEAGISVLGGHTIEDPEPKYGMVVTGSIHPNKIMKNIGAKPGDMLILTKAIGTGVLSTAMKRGMLSEAAKNEVVKTMSELNNKASEIMLKYNVHACTDVTGFGLLGHLSEMSQGSACNVNIDYAKVPFLKDAKSLATAGVIPGGTYNNHKHVKDLTDFSKLSRTDQLLLCDAQTSGGLLIAIDRQDAEKFLNELHENELLNSAVIGEFINSGEGRIQIST